MPITLFDNVSTGHTVVAPPLNPMPIPQLVIALFDALKLSTVWPLAIVVLTLERAEGAVVAELVLAPPETIMPKVVPSGPLVDELELVFMPVPLPLRFRLMSVSLSFVVTVVEEAIRITDVYVTVFAAEFVMVRLRFVPLVLGLSPFITTLSAPLSSITPRPVAVEPDIVTPSAVGLIFMLE